MLRLGAIAAADLEQAHRRSAAIEVSARRRDQARQQRGPHHLHVLADRIRKRPFATAERRRFGVGDEAPRHRLVESARRSGPPHASLDTLRARRGRFRNARRPIERNRGDLVVADDPRDLLDEIRLAVDVRPPARWANLPALRIGKVHVDEPEPDQRRPLESGSDRSPQGPLGARVDRASSAA